MSRDTVEVGWENKEFQIEMGISDPEMGKKMSVDKIKCKCREYGAKCF